MTKFLRFPSLIIWLTVLWCALWIDLSAGNVVGGLLVASLVVAVARPTGVTGLERTYFRPISALYFLINFLWQLVKANLVVAWEIITPGLKINRAIIAVKMHTSSTGVVTVVANAVTLTPGTVTVDIAEREVLGSEVLGSEVLGSAVLGSAVLGSEVPGDGATRPEGGAVRIERTLFIHVLHFIDVESVRRDVLQLERLAIKAFGPRSELPALDRELAELRRADSRHGQHGQHGRSDRSEKGHSS